ncbi:MAG TPA: hypothetical protein VGD40_02555 [Chryseosolibacter sp.]
MNIILRNRISSLIFLFSALCWSCNETEETDWKISPQPRQASKSIINAFGTYQVAGLAEIHYNVETWKLIQQIIKDNQEAQAFRVFAFEGGNSLYQATMDDYVNGGDVSVQELKKVWRNNTLINTTYDAPVYLEFINSIRQANEKLAPGKKFRIILLDPPIDWATVTSDIQFKSFQAQRVNSMIEIIEKEVYAKNEKVLFIAGSNHTSRSLPTAPVPSALSSLEERHPGTTLSIGVYNGFGVDDNELSEIEANFQGWPLNSIVLLEGSAVGEIPAATNTRMKGSGGTLVDPFNGAPLKSVHDALVFVGNRNSLTVSDPATAICGSAADDIAWRNEIIRRQELVKRLPFLRYTFESLCTPLPAAYFDHIR